MIMVIIHVNMSGHICQQGLSKGGRLTVPTLAALPSQGNSRAISQLWTSTQSYPVADRPMQGMQHATTRTSRLYRPRQHRLTPACASPPPRAGNQDQSSQSTSQPVNVTPGEQPASTVAGRGRKALPQVPLRAQPPEATTSTTRHANGGLQKPITGSSQTHKQTAWQDTWGAEPSAPTGQQPAQPGQPSRQAASVSRSAPKAHNSNNSRSRSNSNPLNGSTGRRPSPAVEAVARDLAMQFQAAGYKVPPGWVLKAASMPWFVKNLRVPPTRSAQLPRLPHIIMVEGPADATAVLRAVQAPVYMCDGSSIKSEAAACHLELLSKWPRGLVVLMDPDAPGRELRMFLDEWLVQRPARQGTRPTRVMHAFVPVEQALAAADTKWHEEGSTGIENAKPGAVLRSLKQCRPSFPDSRKEFSLGELQNKGLVNTFDSKQLNGAKLRRKLLCDRLGIDNCTGKSLTTMLNRFFSRQEFEAALQMEPPSQENSDMPQI